MPDSQLVQDTLSAVAADSGQSLLDIIGLAGGFQWPILAVLVLGLGTLMTTLIQLVLERHAITPLAPLATVGADAPTLQAAAANGQVSLYHTILQRLLERHRLGSSSEALERTVAACVTQAREMHERVNRVAMYCSGATGGLGLAGTLVGMYASFSAVGGDPADIYVGVSLALISTLVGLTASLIIEACEALIGRWASIHVSRGREWGEAICLLLERTRTDEN